MFLINKQTTTKTKTWAEDLNRHCHGLGAGWKRISRHEVEWKKKKFIRVGRGESLPAQWAGFLIVRESRQWTGVLDSFLYPGCKEQDRGLTGHLLIGWGRYIGWGGESKAIPSPYMRKERRQDILVRRTWNSLIVTSLGMGGKVNKSLVFPFLHSKTSLVLSAFSTLGHHTSSMQETV